MERKMGEKFPEMDTSFICTALDAEWVLLSGGTGILLTLMAS